ncbi:DUF4307 domain-containing protein [Serinibacter arcticus]|uniref:DUF4307 domain-containing protein n=1 Tax=Serinibacter arcticus TaxID=1655435 RepID=A0A4Z1E0J6_9MICO|nr:DUF4307 domain-containing protein [Serinibacter arcticus]TGO04162.1 hypothetical protein SERN_2753 [Serinibacter arcticus]
MSTTDAEQRARLERRYGARPAAGGRSPGRLAAVAAAVIGVVGTAIVLWLVFGGPGTGASVTGSSYRVVSDSQVTVSFSVLREDPEVPLRCTVQALDVSHAQVGVTLVDVPAGGPRVVPLTVDVTTFARAEQADAVSNGCVAVPE